jgi:AcrR family transcriptional regulator
MTIARRTQRQAAKQDDANSTVSRIRDAARKVFYQKGFFPASVEEIAELARVSRATVYLYFRSKDEMLFDLMRQDLAFQLEQYALLTKLKRVGVPSLRSWLATFRDELDKRRVSLNLFWTGSIIEGYSTEDVDRHRDNIIAILGQRFAGFDLDALGRDAREVQRAKCYMMIFLIEGVSVHFFENSARPNLKIGIDLTARALLHFLSHGELTTGPT